MRSAVMKFKRDMLVCAGKVIYCTEIEINFRRKTSRWKRTENGMKMKRKKFPKKNLFRSKLLQTWKFKVLKLKLKPQILFSEFSRCCIEKMCERESRELGEGG